MDSLEKIGLGGTYYVEAYRDGELLFKDRISNLVVNEGLQKALDDTLLNGTQNASWYVGLLDSSTPAATWTMTDAGGNEVSAYAGTRPAWVGVRTSQTASNTASKAQFVVDSDSTDIYGAFLCTNNTKGGTTGTLFSAGLFTSARTGLMTDDEVFVTYEVEGQSA